MNKTSRNSGPKIKLDVADVLIERSTPEINARALEPTERIDSIDILRGIALFGVLVVNLVYEFRVSIFQQFLPPDRSIGFLDKFAQGFVQLGFEMKAFALFSFLFGIGLAVQFDRLSRTKQPMYWLARRLTILLVFGLFHLLLIWNGDILTEYAFAGLLVLPLLAAPRWVLAAGSACMFALYLVMSVVPMPIAWPDTKWLQQHVTQANHIYATGNLTQTLRFSIQELPSMLPLHIYIIPRTLALFLLGAFTWRAGIVQQPQNHKRLIINIAWVGIAGGVSLTVLDSTGVFDSWRSLDSVREALRMVATLSLAFGYAATIISLAEFSSWRRVLSGFAPVGRMAFTNYILQSVIFGFIFFGYGLGQFGRLGAAPVLVLGIVVYAVQIVLSVWWLRRYRFGPLEWLWRTLMYGKIQPMVRLPSSMTRVPA